MVVPLYIFYPRYSDGFSDTFVTYDLADDDEAGLRALHVLDQHPTATRVVVWCGERKVMTHQRAHPDLGAGPAAAGL